MVTFGLVRFLTFGAPKVSYDVDIFQPMKIHVPKIMNLQGCENEITVFIHFYWLLSGLHIAMTTGVALNLSKKY